MMLAASGLAHGVRRTVPMMLGFQSGLLALLLLVASGLGSAFAAVPLLHVALKALSVAYLPWLASRLWRAGNVGDASSARPLGFFGGAAFQAINPKAWMMTIGAVSAFTLPGPGYWPSVWVLLAAFTVCGLPSVVIWTVFGSLLRSRLANSRYAHWVWRSMALLTVLSCLLILY